MKFPPVTKIPDWARKDEWPDRPSVWVQLKRRLLGGRYKVHDTSDLCDLLQQATRKPHGPVHDSDGSMEKTPRD